MCCYCTRFSSLVACFFTLVPLVWLREPPQAMARRASSPALWPNVSLMILKPSRSIMTTEKGMPDRLERLISNSRCSSSARWFGRPVNESLRAWWLTAACKRALMIAMAAWSARRVSRRISDWLNSHALVRARFITPMIWLPIINGIPMIEPNRVFGIPL